MSFTAILFSLCTRFATRLADRAIRRHGYAGLLSDAGKSSEPHAPTLFAPADRASPVRGRFDAEARSRSLHVLMLRALARLHRRRRVTAVTQPEPSIHNAEAEAPPVAAPTVTEGTA